MELAEAIKHAEEVAAGHEKNCELIKPERKEWEANKKCAEEHRQLAEWLKELKERREAEEKEKQE